MAANSREVIYDKFGLLTSVQSAKLVEMVAGLKKDEATIKDGGTK
jgi:hypothetical protein